MEAKWEACFQAFAAKGESKLDVLFFGDSDIARWKGLERVIPNALCCGAGGAQMSECAKYAPKLFPRLLRPRVIVVLAGENDLAMGMSPKDVVRASLEVADCALQFAQRTFFISTKPEPSTTGLVKLYQTFNSSLAKALSQHHLANRLGFIDCFEAFSSLSPDLFARDGLHLSDRGYRVLEALVVEAIKPPRDSQAAEDGDEGD